MHTADDEIQEFLRDDGFTTIIEEEDDLDCFEYSSHGDFRKNEHGEPEAPVRSHRLVWQAAEFVTVFFKDSHGYDWDLEVESDEEEDFGRTYFLEPAAPSFGGLAKENHPKDKPPARQPYQKGRKSVPVWQRSKLTIRGHFLTLTNTYSAENYLADHM